MPLGWTPTQSRRLNELNAEPALLGRTFKNESTRAEAYGRAEKNLVTENRRRIREYRTTVKRPALCRLESDLVSALIARDFVQVSTPVIMSKGLLKKMSIGVDHPLNAQIYWIDTN